jgi:1,4-alpha-glucan branching enzyme
MVLPSLDWMVDDATRLAECRHDHPFAVLGSHPLPEGGWVVRVWMPEAERVELLLEGQSPRPMANPHHRWIFEADLDHDPGSGYRVRVLRGGIEHEAHDPWAFHHEWMGELDRHLFAEGAFNAAFVPQFAGLAETHGPQAARRFGEQAMAVLRMSTLSIL